MCITHVTQNISSEQSFVFLRISQKSAGLQRTFVQFCILACAQIVHVRIRAHIWYSCFYAKYFIETHGILPPYKNEIHEIQPGRKYVSNCGAFSEVRVPKYVRVI